MPQRNVFAKISRNAEAFWVGDIVELEPGIFKGKIYNDVGMQAPLGHGDTIAFVDAEVKESNDRPRLTVVPKD